MSEATKTPPRAVNGAATATGGLTDDEARLLADDAARPSAFHATHVDPLLWGVCVCEVCWHERAAKRQAEAVEAAAERASEAAISLRRAKTLEDWRNFAWSHDGMMAMVAVPAISFTLLAVWAIGNAVYVWLYH